MSVSENRRIQAVVRALILQEDHLLVTQWQEGYAFPIGGRVEHREPLERALHREVREEIDASGRIRGLLYFCENFFQQGADSMHEFGWYYLFELDRVVCRPGEVLPNPDHSDLSIFFLSLEDVSSYDLRPRFLRTCLPRDVREGFASNPRHVVSRDVHEGERWRETAFGMHTLKDDAGKAQ